ncbi:MAG: hypothetical protein DSM106950_12250 [Stigonema ocellatum SAG 48.90 = DSM 106950]|nr:hypothetical protein [Stigonema ocellatum SAG 48.90 = DSM 106950]
MSLKFMVLPPSLIAIARPPRSCVIDASLALSQYGVPLIQRLGEVMELWMGRELWHILENSAFYLQKPEVITPRGVIPERTLLQEHHAVEETLLSLKEWEKLRVERDLAGLNLFWLGDTPGESLLPKYRNLDIFWHWEAIANALDSKLNSLQTTDYHLPIVFRDTAALAATLKSAFILTYQSPADFDQNVPPEICKVLESWGIPCQFVTSENAIVTLERDYLHQLLVDTDTAKFLWAGVHLAIVHLIFPVTFEVQKQPQPPQANPLSPTEESAENAPSYQNSWISAKGFWYLI